MRCPHCNEKIASHDLWCIKCCRRTNIISKDLSALNSLKVSWVKYKKVKGSNLPVGILASLTGIIPLLVILWILNYTLPVVPKWQFMAISSIVWLFFLPVIIVPLSAVCKKDNYHLDVKDFFSSFTRYMKYFSLMLITVIYYIIIFYVCTGDPILNLVWLVLILYWISIIIPVPIIMERFKCNAFKAIALSYKHAGDLRWNIFLMGIVLTLANVLAAVLLVVGLSITIPFSWFAIRDYVDKMIEYEIFADKVTE